MADQAKAQTINSVFVFGSAARKVTETENSLPALNELSSHQEPAGSQINTIKKQSNWSRVGKFKVDSTQMQGTNYRSNDIKKGRGTATTPRKMNPYELRGQGLKMEEDECAKKKFFNWKMRQQQNLRRTRWC